MLGVEEIIAGSISLVGNTYSVNIRGINVSTGEIINSISLDSRGTIDYVLTQTMEEVARHYVFGKRVKSSGAILFARPTNIDEIINDIPGFIDAVGGQFLPNRSKIVVQTDIGRLAARDAVADLNDGWRSGPACSGITCYTCSPGLGILVVPITSALGYYKTITIPSHHLEQFIGQPIENRHEYIKAYESKMRNEKLKRGMQYSFIGYVAGAILWKIL